MNEDNHSKERRTTYRLVSSVCRTHGAEGCRVYGLQSTELGSSGEKTLKSADISPQKQAVEELIAKLQKWHVELSQIEYIVEDYIAVM